MTMPMQESACFYCSSKKHAMAIEVGPDVLCWEEIRSRAGAFNFATRVTAYWRWVYGMHSFKALLEA